MTQNKMKNIDWQQVIIQIRTSLFSGKRDEAAKELDTYIAQIQEDERGLSFRNPGEKLVLQAWQNRPKEQEPLCPAPIANLYELRIGMEQNEQVKLELIEDGLQWDPSAFDWRLERIRIRIGQKEYDAAQNELNEITPWIFQRTDYPAYYQCRCDLALSQNDPVRAAVYIIYKGEYEEPAVFRLAQAEQYLQRAGLSAKTYPIEEWWQKPAEHDIHELPGDEVLGLFQTQYEKALKEKDQQQAAYYRTIVRNMVRQPDVTSMEPVNLC